MNEATTLLNLINIFHSNQKKQKTKSFNQKIKNNARLNQFTALLSFSGTASFECQTEYKGRFERNEKKKKKTHKFQMMCVTDCE